MNSIQRVKPAWGALVILYICLSSFVLHLGVSNIASTPHQDSILFSESSTDNDATDPHPHEDDMKNTGEMIPYTLMSNPAHEWGTFLPAQTNPPDRLTPPPKNI